MYESAYEDAYKATVTVLQDQGYIIKNTDIDTGLILASVDKNASTGSKIAQVLLVGFAFDRGSEIEASCVVNKLNDTNTEIRISIQEVQYGDASIFSGSSKRNVKQIYNSEVYRIIFNEIAVEIKRREAFNPIYPPLQKQEAPKKLDIVAKEATKEIRAADTEKYDMQIPVDAEDLGAMLREAEDIYKEKRYGEAIALAGKIKKRIESTSHSARRAINSARVNLLFGAYFYDVRKLPNVAKTYFDDVAKSLPDINIGEAIYGENVVKYFRSLLKENKEISNLSKAEAPQSKDRISAVSEIRKGSKVRIIKKDAELHVKPDEQSEIITTIPLGALLDVDGVSGDWIRIRLPQNKDGFAIVGYIHDSLIVID
jgi:hypothetical protein